MKRVLFIDGLGFVSRLEDGDIQFSETFEGARGFDHPATTKLHIESNWMVGNATCIRDIWVFAFYSRNEFSGLGLLYVEGKGFMGIDGGWVLRGYFPALAKRFGYADFARACREMGRRPGMDAWLVKISI